MCSRIKEMQSVPYVTAYRKTGHMGFFPKIAIVVQVISMTFELIPVQI